MATKGFSVICLVSLVLQASYALPIGQTLTLTLTLDVNNVELSDGVRDSVFTERSPAMLDILSRPSEDIKRVQSFTLVEALPSAGILGRRVKRDFMKSGQCSGEMVPFHKICLTKEQYDAMKVKKMKLNDNITTKNLMTRYFLSREDGLDIKRPASFY